MRTSRGTWLSLHRRQDRRYMRNALRRIAALESAGKLDRADEVRRTMGRIAAAQCLGETWHGNTVLQEQVKVSNEKGAKDANDKTAECEEGGDTGQAAEESAGAVEAGGTGGVGQDLGTAQRVETEQ